MKYGLYIGGLVLALCARGSDLLAEGGQWRAVDNPPRTEAAATLDRPVALKAAPDDGATKPVLPPNEILPAGFEMPAASTEKPVLQRVSEKRSSPPGPEIIAVSAPVRNPATAPAGDEEEQTESLFAVDRPLRPIFSTSRPGAGSIVQTAATTTDPPASMLPGWDAPVDSSWSASPQTSWSPRQPNVLGEEGGAGIAGPGSNPLGQRFYARGEYLLWWLQRQQIPVLATTSSASDFGILGAPSTTVLFGGNGINSGPFSGFRGTVGYWLGCNADKAVEFTGFFVGPRSGNFSVNSITTPVIGRPFLEANNGTESAQLTALPGVTAGALTIHAPTTLWGLEGNLRCLLCCGCNYRITGLAGFRNINLNESLSMREDIQGLSTAPQPFTDQQITVLDSFATQNHFYGGQVGASALWYWGRWNVNVLGKVALGDTVQQLDISGSQRFVSPSGNVQNFTGGLLALPSNIGHFTNNAFSVVPEITVNLGYQFTPHVRAFVGYNFLYWSNVIRPGTSIDRSLDVTQIPNFPLNPEPSPVPGLHPAPNFHQVGFWAQGVNFGLQFTY